MYCTSKISLSTNGEKWRKATINITKRKQKFKPKIEHTYNILIFDFFGYP